MSTYIVYGSTGDYDDYYRNWPVAEFSTKQRAETWARKANEWARENAPAPPYGDDLPENPYDPWMQVDYGGVHYNAFKKLVLPMNPPLPRA